MRYTSITDLPPALREQAEREIAKQGPARKITAPQTTAKPAKYRNEPTLVAGERYDSKLEWRMCEWLTARWELGEVLWFIRQVPFVLEGGVRYRGDALAVVANGPPHVEVWDAKGKDTQASINKRKQVLARYGVRVLLWPDDAGLPPGGA